MKRNLTAAKSTRPWRGILSNRDRAALALEGVRRQQAHAEELRRKRLGLPS